MTAHLLLHPTGDPESDLAQVEYAAAERDRIAETYGSDSFRIVGVKFILDGVVDGEVRHRAS